MSFNTFNAVNTVWYHPFRMDRWMAGLPTQQSINLLRRIDDEYLSHGIRRSKKDLKREFEQTMAEQQARRSVRDWDSIGLLREMREHHVSCGGAIWDMEHIAHYLDATWAGPVNLGHIQLPAFNVYIHIGTTLFSGNREIDMTVEGFYIQRAIDKEAGAKRWVFTFVCAYPDFEGAEDDMPSDSEELFGRMVSIMLPDDFDVSRGDYEAIPHRGHGLLVEDTRHQWYLVRLAVGAMLWLSQADPDEMAFVDPAPGDDVRMADVYRCGLNTFAPDTDWTAAKLKPGTWIVEDEGSPDRPMVVRWIKPTIVSPAEEREIARSGGKILQFNR